MDQSQSRKKLFAGAALLCLAAITAYGFAHERLLAQPIWFESGQFRFLFYTGIYWALAVFLIWIRPAALGLVAAVAAVAYAAWWAGPLAVLAPIFLLGSCYHTGRILFPRTSAISAVVTGICAWIFLIGIALHFPVNYRSVYWLALAVPYGATLFQRDRTLAVVPDSSSLFHRGRAGAASLGVLLYFLIAHLLIALKPEVSADGLSMHLALPMDVAIQGRWGFEFAHYAWSLMPAGGDALFTAAYMLGGEAGARLTNFALMVLIAGGIVSTSRRWLTPSKAVLAGALFVSTPMVQLVTGSLFVENVWALMILAGSIALVDYYSEGSQADLTVAAVMFGTALTVKLQAGAFLVPAALVAAAAAWKHRQMRTLAWAALLGLLLASPPYLYAAIRSGNPIFPFYNAVFKSPYYYSGGNLDDPRYHVGLTWKVFYQTVFQSEKFFEGQGGGIGFQYFLLLLPAALLARGKRSWIPLAIGFAGAFVILAKLPNLRYLYPALPLMSLALWPLVEHLTVVIVLIAGLNAWFLPASGWYHKEFALFTQEQVEAYKALSGPERRLVEHLNEIAPGEPVAFFNLSGVAGLKGRAYTDSWHTENYWIKLRTAKSTNEAAALMKSLGIRNVIAPSSLQHMFPPIENFMREWLEPGKFTSGRYGLFTLRDHGVPYVPERPALTAGVYDDLDWRFDYQGYWLHDTQFKDAAAGSITYSDVPGNVIRFSFNGDSLTYVYTKALNRGTARVVIDGVEKAVIDEYSAKLVWQASSAWAGLGEGTHKVEIEVLKQKHRKSTGTYVDLDRIVIQ